MTELQQETITTVVDCTMALKQKDYETLRQTILKGLDTLRRTKDQLEKDLAAVAEEIATQEGLATRLARETGIDIPVANGNESELSATEIRDVIEQYGAGLPMTSGQIQKAYYKKRRKRIPPHILRAFLTAGFNNGLFTRDGERRSTRWGIKRQ